MALQVAEGEHRSARQEQGHGACIPHLEGLGHVERAGLIDGTLDKGHMHIPLRAFWSTSSKHRAEVQAAVCLHRPPGLDQYLHLYAVPVELCHSPQTQLSQLGNS